MVNIVNEKELNKYLDRLVMSLKTVRDNDLPRQKILLDLIKEVLEIKRLNKEFIK